MVPHTVHAAPIYSILTAFPLSSKWRKEIDRFRIHVAILVFRILVGSGLSLDSIVSLDSDPDWDSRSPSRPAKMTHKNI
jgi:hypothetical protein